MTLKDKLIANKKQGGKRIIQTIDYDLLAITILTGHLDEFIVSTGVSKGLLSMYLGCAESYIDEMLAGHIPTIKWLANASSKVKIAVKRIENRLKKEGV